MTLGTNLLGPFALTNLLLPRVRSQIINVGSNAERSATLRPGRSCTCATTNGRAMGAYAQSKLAVMLWGLELDRRLRAAGSPVVSHLTHPGWVASNLSEVSDSPLMALSHKVVKAVADRLANDIDEGAAPTLYCISEPIPPGSYVGVSGKFGLRGGPVLIGRSELACDYDAAARVVASPKRRPAQRFPLCLTCAVYPGVLADHVVAQPPHDRPADEHRQPAGQHPVQQHRRHGDRRRARRRRPGHRSAPPRRRRHRRGWGPPRPAFRRPSSRR